MILPAHTELRQWGVDATLPLSLSVIFFILIIISGWGCRLGKNPLNSALKSLQSLWLSSSDLLPLQTSAYKQSWPCCFPPPRLWRGGGQSASAPLAEKRMQEVAWVPACSASEEGVVLGEDKAFIHKADAP